MQKTAYERRISDWSSDEFASGLKDERRGRNGREAGQRRLAAPEQGAETLRPFPVAIGRIGRAPIAFELRHPFGAARAVTARRLEIGKFFDRPHFDRHAGKARYRDRKSTRLNSSH